MMHPFTKTENGVFEGYELVASGYTAVWAKENTRAAIWDAMERKEVYGTTGPRMMVRFFGGWDYTAEDMNSRQPAFRGYEKGVPMGGDLPARAGGGAPTFMVYALRDPIGANLDRIQIVKGWLDAEGKTHEKVYDVAWSAGREPDASGVLPAGRQHGGRRGRQLDQHDRSLRARNGLDRPGLRSGPERVLLRPCARDPHPALGGVRRIPLRNRHPRGR